MEKEEFENSAIRDVLIISIVSLIIVAVLVIWGFKILLGL